MKIGALALVLFIGIVVAGGCRRNSTPPPTAPPLAPAATPQLAHTEGGNIPTAETKYFKGSIGSSLDLQMKLVRSGDLLSGSYFYQRIGTRINLRGKIEPDGHLDRKSTRLNSSHSQISYAVFCLKKKNRSPTPSTST